MRLMNGARVAGDRLTSKSTSRPARSFGSTHADVPVAQGASAACRPLHGLNSICAVSTRLKPGAIDLVPPTAAESLQAPCAAQHRGAATDAAAPRLGFCPIRVPSAYALGYSDVAAPRLERLSLGVRRLAAALVTRWKAA